MSFANLIKQVKKSEIKNRVSIELTLGLILLLAGSTYLGVFVEINGYVGNRQHLLHLNNSSKGTQAEAAVRWVFTRSVCLRPNWRNQQSSAR